jgi:hypothetical protein
MSESLDYSSATSLEGRCLALKKCIQEYLKKDKVDHRELVELANSFDYSLVRSKSAETRKLAALFVGFILHLLHAKSPVGNKYGFFDSLEVSGPFISKGSFIYLSFNEETDFSFTQKFVNSTLSKQDDILFNYAVKRSNDQRVLLLGVCVHRTLQILSQPNLLDCLPDPQTTCIFINSKQGGMLPFLNLELHHLGYAEWRRTYKGFSDGLFSGKLHETAKHLFGLDTKSSEICPWPESIREKTTTHFRGLVRFIQVQNRAKSKRQNSAADLIRGNRCIEDLKRQKPVIKICSRTNSSNKFRLTTSEHKTSSHSSDTKSSIKKSATDSDKPPLGKAAFPQQNQYRDSSNNQLKKLQSLSFDQETSVHCDSKQSRFVRVSRKVKSELPGPATLSSLMNDMPNNRVSPSLGLDKEAQPPPKHNFFLKKSDSPKKQLAKGWQQPSTSPGSPIF